jgi:hypothetical protein
MEGDVGSVLRVMRKRGDIPSCEAKWTFLAFVGSVSSVRSYMPAYMLRARECGRAHLVVSMRRRSVKKQRERGRTGHL